MKSEINRKILYTTKMIATWSIVIRVTKFILGIIIFIIIFTVIAPTLSANWSISDIIGTGGFFVFLLFFWILLTIASRILLIIWIIKVSSLPESLGVERNNLIMSKLSAIKITAIIGFFVSYVDLVSMVLFLMLNSRFQKELINPYEIID